MAAARASSARCELGPDGDRRRGRRPRACAAAAAPASRPASSGRPWPTPPAAQKYIVCNADEGDSGTFADRMMMEGDPFLLIEGMTIAGLAVGATRGYIYIRSEYPHAIAAMERGDRRRPRRRAARRARRRLGHASTSRCASAPAPMSAARRPRCSTASRASAAWSAPSRRCRRIEGLFGQPTVINNVLSLAAVPFILAEGAEAYADFGMGRSRGTMPIQLAGNITHGGLFETAFGITLGELVDEIGGGTASGRPVRAVQVGGPLGAYFPPALFDTPLRLRGLRRARRADRPRRHRRVRRHASTWRSRRASPSSSAPSKAAASARPAGSARCAASRPSTGSSPASDRAEHRAGRGPLRHDEVRIALRAGRLHPLSRDERADAFPRGLRRPRRAPAGSGVRTPMTLIHEIDFGTPAVRADATGHPHHRRRDGHGAGRHLDHARGDAAGHRDPQALRHRHAGCLRLLPALPGRDRGPRGHAGLLHHAGRRRAWSFAPRPSGWNSCARA